jgi:hypothetical protein
MDKKNLLYLGLAAGAGYAACYYFKAVPLANAGGALIKSYAEYIRTHPDPLAPNPANLAPGTQNGMAGQRVSAHQGARLLGAWRAMSYGQELKPSTYALYNKFGVSLEQDPDTRQYTIDPYERGLALADAGGRGVRAHKPTNLAD